MNSSPSRHHLQVARPAFPVGDKDELICLREAGSSKRESAIEPKRAHEPKLAHSLPIAEPMLALAHSLLVAEPDELYSIPFFGLKLEAARSRLADWVRTFFNHEDNWRFLRSRLAGWIRMSFSDVSTPIFATTSRQGLKSD